MSSTKAGLALGKTSVEKSVDWAIKTRPFEDVDWATKTRSFKDNVITDMYDLRDYLTEELETQLDSGPLTKEQETALKKQLARHKEVDWEALDGIVIAEEYHHIHSTSKAFYELLMATINNEWMLAIPNPLGRHCGLSLYSQRPVKRINGVNLPESLRVFDHMPTSLQNALAKRLKDAIYCYKQVPSYRNEKVFYPLLAQWESFVRPLINPTANYKSSALYGQSAMEATFLINGAAGLPIAPNTCDLPWSNHQHGYPLMVSPSADWFPEQVRALKPEEIFSLFPPAELKVMMLLIGRAMVGPSGSIPFGYPDQKIVHNFRTSAIIKGVPGSGKSEFLKLISQTMELFGYVAKPFRSLDDRFGLGELAEASFIFKDDTSDVELARLIHSSNFKTYVTGGYVCAEKKHKDATYIPSRGVVVLCTNEWNPNNVYSVDEGIQSRLRILETVDADARDATLASLPADHLWHGAENLSPNKLIEHLARKLKVAPQAIVARFLCHCTEYFYSHIDTLEATDKSLECQLITRIPADPLLTTTRAFKLALALNKASYNNRLTAMTVHDTLYYMYELMFDARSHKVLDALKANWQACGRDPRHPWVAFRDLSYSGVRTALDYSYHALKLDIETYKPDPVKMTSGSRDLTLEVFLKAAFGHLHTWAGIKINTSPASIIKSWDEQSSYASQIDKIVAQVGKHMPDDYGYGDDARLYRLWWRPAMRSHEIRQARLAHFNKMNP